MTLYRVAIACGSEALFNFDDPRGLGRPVGLFRRRFWLERRVPTTFRPGSSTEQEVVRFPLLQRVQKRYWPIAYRPAADSSGPPDFALFGNNGCGDASAILETIAA